MLRVEELNRIEDLDAIHLVWRRLLDRTKRATFFQSLEWLKTYWRSFGERERLRTLVVFRAGEEIGIVPLVVRCETTRLGPIRTLTYPLHDWSSFYGPITAEPASTLHAAMHHLARSRRDWDVLDLRWLRADVDLNHTPRAMLDAGFGARRGVWNESTLVDTTGSWDDYLTSRSIRFRSNIRRIGRRIERLGGFAFERYRPLGAASGDADPRWDVYDECVELARRSWQGSSQDGTTLSHPEVALFLRDQWKAAVHAGAGELVLLRHDEKLVAFAYNLHRGGQVYGLRMGADPDHREASVGNYLLARTIEDSCERGDVEIDLGPGSADVKSPWRTSFEPIGRVTHYVRLSPRAQLLRLKRVFSDRQAVPSEGKA